VKDLRHKELELQNLILQSKSYNEKIKQLNSTLVSAVDKLKNGNFIFKMSSSERKVTSQYFINKDFVNMTSRINTNFHTPDPEYYNIQNLPEERIMKPLPWNFLEPYPREDQQMMSSFLKFNLEESSRLKAPVIIPNGGVIKKDTLLRFEYPEKNEGVFFRYTFSKDHLPSFFSGERFDSINPPVLNRDVSVRVVACKFGYLDSEVREVFIKVSEHEGVEGIVERERVAFDLKLERPTAEIRAEEVGFNITRFDQEMDDDSSSLLNTPGSGYYLSVRKTDSHRAENVYRDNDDFL